MKNGLDFDLAFQLDDVSRGAYFIIFSEMEGRQFDWGSMSFKKET